MFFRTNAHTKSTWYPKIKRVLGSNMLYQLLFIQPYTNVIHRREYLVQSRNQLQKILLAVNKQFRTVEIKQHIF